MTIKGTEKTHPSIFLHLQIWILKVNGICVYNEPWKTYRVVFFLEQNKKDQGGGTQNKLNKVGLIQCDNHLVLLDLVGFYLVVT